MKLFLKMALSAILITFFSVSAAFAGEYSEKGYIVMVKANNVGPSCFLGLSQTMNGPIFQGGVWKCSGTDGANMLYMASIAKLYGLPVEVIFEGNGAEFKPVYAVQLN